MGYQLRSLRGNEGNFVIAIKRCQTLRGLGCGERGGTVKTKKRTKLPGVSNRRSHKGGVGWTKRP